MVLFCLSAYTPKAILFHFFLHKSPTSGAYSPPVPSPAFHCLEDSWSPSKPSTFNRAAHLNHLGSLSKILRPKPRPRPIKPCNLRGGARHQAFLKLRGDCNIVGDGNHPTQCQVQRLLFCEAAASHFICSQPSVHTYRSYFSFQ